MTAVHFMRCGLEEARGKYERSGELLFSCYLLAGIEKAGSGLVLEGKVGRQGPLQP